MKCYKYQAFQLEQPKGDGHELCGPHFELDFIVPDGDWSLGQNARVLEANVLGHRDEIPGVEGTP